MADGVGATDRPHRHDRDPSPPRTRVGLIKNAVACRVRPDWRRTARDDGGEIEIREFAVERKPFTVSASRRGC